MVSLECSDVIDGTMLEVHLMSSRTGLNCGNLKILMPRLFTDLAFDCCVIPHTTVL